MIDAGCYCQIGMTIFKAGFHYGISLNEIFQISNTFAKHTKCPTYALVKTSIWFIFIVHVF